MTIDSHSEERADWFDVAHSGSLVDFSECANVDYRSLSLEAHDAVILPRNSVLGATFPNINAFARSSKEILIALKNGGLETGLYDDGRENRYLVLKSLEEILPIIVFVGESVAAIGLNILASLIYDRFVRKDKQHTPIVKYEYLVVERDGEIKRWRRIEGSADEVHKALVAEAVAIHGYDPDESLYAAEVLQMTKHIALTLAHNLPRSRAGGVPYDFRTFDRRAARGA